MSDPKYIRRGVDFAIAHLVEECGEVLAAAGKTQRFGLDSYNPELHPELRETNRDWLLRELCDLQDAILRVRHEITLAAIARTEEIG
jgi:NTP pyrophosphatase (non-canonical NTP hydrolase)